MLRTRSGVRALGWDDREAALDFCARDIGASVFVAARIEEGALDGRQGSLLGITGNSGLEAMMWTSANVVPLGLDESTRPLFAERLRRGRSRTASILGPVDQVLPLWDLLKASWGGPRAIRESQPLLATSTPPSALGIAMTDAVRPARVEEVDLVMPAAEHMFTAEIGYPPYAGSPRLYRRSLAAMIERGQTYVIVHDGKVLFKADVGSAALGCAQVQGVWLAPELRGQGLAGPAMAATIEQVMIEHAPLVTLYVNHFNAPALATYRSCGMSVVGEFATVLL